MKCHQYWEPKEDEMGEHGNFKVKTTAIDSNENYSVASLEITNIKTDETRNVSHWQFTSWRKFDLFFFKVKVEDSRRIFNLLLHDLTCDVG